MTNQQTPLIWLRTFVAAARHSSFTRAAAELHLTQAAVSKHMRALELHLGQTLFVRQAHGLQLTELGSRYQVEVEAAIQNLDNATSDLFGLHDHKRLQLHCNLAFCQWWLVPRLPDLYQRYPSLEIELHHSIWDTQNEPIKGDIHIRYGLSNNFDEHTLRLTNDRLIPMAAQGLPAAELASLPLLHVLGYRHGWHWYAEQLDRADVLSRPQRSVDNSVIAYQMAAQGLGLVLVRSGFVHHPWIKANLQTFDWPACDTPESFFAMLRDSYVLSEQLNTLWGWLKQQIDSNVDV
ncbi:MAG: LysR family transcriptional regulator [Gammaproteobacteria bacterium]|nr:LysR family transcriptional regulator [Gammaproteobacteria bacterium]